MSVDFIKQFLQKQVKQRLDGPTAYERQKASMLVWGEVKNTKNEKLFEAYRFIDGYELTARGATEAALAVLNDKVAKGTMTPSLAFGHQFMEPFIIEKVIELQTK